jgi:hypothetical protein
MMTSLTSRYQVLNKYTIVDMFISTDLFQCCKTSTMAASSAQETPQEQFRIAGCSDVDVTKTLDIKNQKQCNRIVRLVICVCV